MAAQTAAQTAFSQQPAGGGFSGRGRRDDVVTFLLFYLFTRGVPDELG